MWQILGAKAAQRRPRTLRVLVARRGRAAQALAEPLDAVGLVRLHAERVRPQVAPQHKVLRAWPQLARRGRDGATMVGREHLGDDGLALLDRLLRRLPRHLDAHRTRERPRALRRRAAIRRRRVAAERGEVEEAGRQSGTGEVRGLAAEPRVQCRRLLAPPQRTLLCRRCRRAAGRIGCHSLQRQRCCLWIGLPARLEARKQAAQRAVGLGLGDGSARLVERRRVRGQVCRLQLHALLRQLPVPGLKQDFVEALRGVEGDHGARSAVQLGAQRDYGHAGVAIHAHASGWWGHVERDATLRGGKDIEK